MLIVELQSFEYPIVWTLITTGAATATATAAKVAIIITIIIVVIVVVVVILWWGGHCWERISAAKKTKMKEIEVDEGEMSGGEMV